MRTNVQIAGAAFRMTCYIFLGFIIMHLGVLPMLDGVGQIAGLWRRSYYTTPAWRMFRDAHVNGWIFLENYGMSVSHAAIVTNIVVPLIVLLVIFLLIFGLDKFLNRRGRTR